MTYWLNYEEIWFVYRLAKHKQFYANQFYFNVFRFLSLEEVANEMRLELLEI